MSREQCAGDTEAEDGLLQLAAAMRTFAKLLDSRDPSDEVSDILNAELAAVVHGWADQGERIADTLQPLSYETLR